MFGKRSSKTVAALIVAAAMVLAAAAGAVGSKARPASAAEAFSIVHPFRSMDGYEMVEEMGMGINLGNTLDANSGQMPNEGAWGAPVTTKEMIKKMHDLGYGTLRIPVTWGEMISHEAPYEVNPIWMNRVQNVVDYAIEIGMYVMVNMHHDGAEGGGWLTVGGDREYFDSTLPRYEGAWRDIATRFKAYDEHLMFASMNEINDSDKGSATGGGDGDTQAGRISELNQLFVDTVRQTGGNNDKRWLIVLPSYATPEKLADEDWLFPTDEHSSADANRIMVEMHHYSTSDDGATRMATQRKTIIAKAAARGVTEFVPMVIGEFGFLSGTQNNFGAQSNVTLFARTARAAKVYGYVPCLWDTPGDVPSTLFDRRYPETAGYGPTEGTDNNGGTSGTRTYTHRSWRAMLRAVKNPLSAQLQKTNTGEDVALLTDYNIFHGIPSLNANPAHATLSERAVIKPVTGFELQETEIKLTVGDKIKTGAENILPANTTDVLVWNSSDDQVANVTDGVIIAKSAGEATITVFNQGGGAATTTSVKRPGIDGADVKRTMTVTVVPKANAVSAVTGITVEEEESVEITEDAAPTTCVEVTRMSNRFLTLFVTPSDTTDTFTFTSSNREVATVNGVGKIYGAALGITYVTITASSGYTKTVKVAVTGTGAETEMQLSLNLMFPALNNANESGEPVTVTGNGQYTVVFDVDADMTPANLELLGGENATINNIVSAYIKDVAVQGGMSSVSPVDSCEISFDSIEISNRAGDKKSLSIRTYDEIVASPDAFDASVGDAYNGYYVRGATHVNGTPMEGPDGKYWKTALRADTGVVDTNDPINGWDGSVCGTDDIIVPGRGSSNPQVSFTGITDPSKISVTFTLRNLVFSVDTYTPQTAETGLARVTGDAENTVKAYETATVGVSVAGEYSAEKYPVGVTFYSSDSSVIMTDNNSIVVPAAGVASMKVTALKPGTATVTAVTDQGFSQTFGFTVTVNKDILQAKYDSTGELDESLYSQSTWSTLVSARLEAKTVLEKAGASQPEIDEALEELESAEAALRLKPGDKTALSARYDELKNTAQNLYTPASWSGFASALEAAETILDDPDATQAEVDGTLDDLNEAFGLLVSRADTADLGALIEDAEELLEADYTPASWTDFASALGAAKDVFANGNATQSAVNAAYEALDGAMDALVERADTADLGALIEDAEELLEADYTPASWTDFASALGTAKDVFANVNATQSAVNAAYEALDGAMDALVERADTADLGALIEDAEELTEADYTPASWTDFASALGTAKDVFANVNATQSAVNAAYEALDGAMDALEEPAPAVDKTELEELIADAEELLEADYTAATWEDFAEALSSAQTVFADADAGQDAVNSAFEDLEDAIEALEEKQTGAKSGCGSAASGGSAAAMALFAILGVLLIAKRKTAKV